MIIEEKKKKIVQSHNFESTNCTIDAEDMRFVASLLRNNYSNTALAVVREISANAQDANVQAKSKRKIEISLPSKLSPTFCVRDFGEGLSQEDVFGIYSKYGKSTKRNSNDYIGAFGIGKFAPLSYGENFTCVSYHGGNKTSYNVFVDDNDDTKIVKLDEERSNDPTGLSVEVAVLEDDISNFRTIIQNFFEFFPNKEMPHFIGNDGTFPRKRDVIIESKNKSWLFLSGETSNSYYRSNSNAHIIMGRVAYPLNFGAIQVDNFVEDHDKKDVIINLLQQSNFYLRLPLGSVKLHHSRESIEYNKASQQAIIGAMLKACEEVQEIAKEKLADSDDLWEAKASYARIVNSMPYNMRNIFCNAFEWNGIKIDSPSFHRPHSMNDDLILTHTTRENDSSARDGFKVRSTKTHRIHCDNESLFLMQDIESSHGNNLRARTLFCEDENLQTIFFINPLNVKAKAQIKDWGFNLIDEKHIRYTSKVAKQKIEYGQRKSDGSRASIPLFELKKKNDNYNKTNISYWENVKSDIDEMNSSTDGSIDGKLVYIPIKNYQIDSSEFDLTRIYALARRVRARAKDKSAQKDFSLFGVRSGDVKKLDKKLWISFEDFFKKDSKKFVLDNLALSKKAFDKILSESDPKLRLALEGHRYSTFYVFNSKLLSWDSLGKDHFLNKFRDKLLSFEDERILEVHSAIIFLNKSEKDWVEFNLDNGFSTKQFAKDLSSIKKKYPLLSYLGNSVSHREKHNNDLFQEIKEYILLCDKN